MSQLITPSLREAQQFAATAHVFAVIALAVVGINIGIEIGVPVIAAIGDDSKSWREHLHSIGLVAIALLPAILFFEAVNQLRRALNSYSEGLFYSEAAANHVASAGDFATSAVVAIVLLVPNLTLWVSKRGGFDVNFDSNAFGMLAFALFISVVGRVLAAAAELKAENDSFV